MIFDFWFWYILSFIACILSLVTKNKKWFIWIILFSIFILMSSAVPTKFLWSDLNNYEVSYKSLSSSFEISLSNDWLFNRFEYFCKILGMNFMQCKAVIMLICVMGLYFVLKYYLGEYIGFVLLFFQVHLIFNYEIILRNSFAFIFVLFGLRYLVDDSISFRRIKYLCCIFIGAQIHSMTWLYLLLVVVTFSKTYITKYKKIYMLLGIFLFVYLIIVIRTGKIISFFAGFFGGLISSDKYVSYAVAKSRYAWISVVLIWGATIINILYVYYLHKKRNRSLVINKKCFKLKEMVLVSESKCVNIEKIVFNFMLVLLLSSVYVPLCIFTLHMARFLKYMSLVNIINMGLFYKMNYNNRGMRLYIFVSTLLISLLWLYFDMNIYGGYTPEIIESYCINGTYFWQ